MFSRFRVLAFRTFLYVLFYVFGHIFSLIVSLDLGMKLGSAMDNPWRCLQDLMLTFYLGKWPVSDRGMKAESDPELIMWRITNSRDLSSYRMPLKSKRLNDVFRDEPSEPWSLTARWSYYYFSGNRLPFIFLIHSIEFHSLV